MPQTNNKRRPSTASPQRAATRWRRSLGTPGATVGGDVDGRVGAAPVAGLPRVARSSSPDCRSSPTPGSSTPRTRRRSSPSWPRRHESARSTRLVAHLQHVAVPSASRISLGELAVGAATLVGLWSRAAAVGGMLLSFSLFLTVSFHASPYYTGSDIVFVFAWTPLLVAGAGGVLSLDALSRDMARARAGVGARHRGPGLVRRRADGVRRLRRRHVSGHVGGAVRARAVPVSPPRSATTAARPHWATSTGGLSRSQGIVRRRLAGVAWRARGSPPGLGRLGGKPGPSNGTEPVEPRPRRPPPVERPDHDLAAPATTSVDRATTTTTVRTPAGHADRVRERGARSGARRRSRTRSRVTRLSWCSPRQEPSWPSTRCVPTRGASWRSRPRHSGSSARATARSSTGGPGA